MGGGNIPMKQHIWRTPCNLEMRKTFLADTQNQEAIKRKENSNYRKLLNGRNKHKKSP